MLKRIRSLHREDGQSIATIGLMSMFLLVIIGLAADTGFVWLQRRNLQNSADAAALAAAQQLPGDEAGAETVARDFAAKNVSGLTSVDVAFGDRLANGQPTSVKVTPHKDSESLFGVGLGFGNKAVSAKAKAKIRSQNLPGPGVVPIGVEKSDYDALATSGGDVTLKDKKQDGATSNAGLIQLIGDTGDQIRSGLQFGSTVPLTPSLLTEPGDKLGQATQNTNSGLRVRLTRALAHAWPSDNTKHCYTWADVQPPADPNGYWPCSPFNATESDGVQATAVILVPIIVEDFTLISGSGPQKSISVQPTAGGEAYLLAYFWVDGDSTYVDPASGNYDNDPLNPKGAIFGRFLRDVPTQLSEFDPDQCKQSNGCELVDYDPDAVIKVVQLVE